VGSHEFLLTLAEVAAAFAGFSTLISFVAARKISNLEPTRIIAMLALSIMVVLFSLLPSLPELYGLDTYWHTLCALYAAAWLFYFAGIVNNLRLGGLGANLKSLPILNKINTFGIHPISIIVLILGAGRFINIPPSWLYVTGLFVMLFLSAQLFIQIVISLIRSEFDDGGDGDA